MLQENFNKIIK